MSKLFWVDKNRGIHKTYSDFLSDLNSLNRELFYIYEENPYTVFLQLTYHILQGTSVTLIDSEFSPEEIQALGIGPEDIKAHKAGNQLNIGDEQQLLEALNSQIEKAKIALYTSGTTGKPKRVTHTLSNLIRNVRTGNKFEKHTWAFAYNPTHFAGLQVFFQAFFNLNTIIYIFDAAVQEIEETLREYKVTHISATPTFYRLFIPFINRENHILKRVTMGGEKFDSQMVGRISALFPMARVRNIYASTEAGSLFNSDNDRFILTKDIEHLIRVENNELFVHKSLLGEFDNYRIEDEWYNTGDIVEIDKNEIKFVGRRNDFINIGGYKVNPHEVADEIKKIEDVLDVQVYARSNSVLGHILVADIVINPGIDKQVLKKQINKTLPEKLQKWKIPGILNFVNELTTTRTGKKAVK